MCSAQCIHTGLKMECLTGQEHKGRKPFLIRRKRVCQGIFRGTETEIKFGLFGEGAESSEAGMEIGAKTQTQSVNFNFWSRSATSAIWQCVGQVGTLDLRVTTQRTRPRTSHLEG